MPLALALFLTACPVEIGLDRAHPPRTALATADTVFARIAGHAGLGCAPDRVQLFLESDPKVPAPISFRLETGPVRLILEIPEVFVPLTLGPQQRLERWQAWDTWTRRVRELLREAEATGANRLVLPPDGPARLQALEQGIAANLQAARKEAPQPQPDGPFLFGEPRRIGPLQADQEVFWSGAEVCHAPNGQPDAPVRCFDPKTRRWSRKPRASRPPHPEPTPLQTSYSTRRERCELVTGKRTWPLAELGLDLGQVLDREPESFTETRCSRGAGKDAQQVRRRVRCPSTLALSPDGTLLAFTLDVLMVTTTCSTRGTRADDSETEVLETLLLLAPVRAREGTR